MKSVRYTAWDGTRRPFTLKRSEIARAFMDNLMEGMDPNMAMAQMLWEGFPLAGMNFRVMGLREMLENLQRQKQDLLSRYTLNRAFDEPMQALQDLIGEEAHTRRQMGKPPPPTSEQLPPGLLEKISSLKDFPFLNDASREAMEQWRDREDDIRELLEFYSAWAHRFTGDIPLDFEQALELMKQLKALEQMEQQLRSGQWQQIDQETLKELLGDEASQSLAILLQVPGQLAEDGLVRFGKEGFDLTPRGIRAIGEMAFGDLYHMVKRDHQGDNAGNAPEAGDMEPDSSRPYTFGDRFDLDISRTLLQSVTRRPTAERRIELKADDFFVRQREQLVTSTTVMLLDLSWSMSWQRRFQAAKKVALALDHFVRTKFPKDTFHVVGFSTEARELPAKELALAVWDMGNAFTNLQAGIRKACDLIRRSGSRNNRVIVLTDGQPTAYYDNDQLRVEFPTSMYGLSPNACRATLSEIKKATAQGVHIDTFMLDDNPVLVEFVREISRINGGQAVICVPDEIGKLILHEEVRRRRKN